MTTHIRAALLIAGLLIVAGGAVPVSAQQKDSIWVVEWFRDRLTPSGDRYGDEIDRVWLDGDKMLVRVANERYVSVIGDSLYMIDTFHTVYSTGPTKRVDMLWLKENLIRHRGTAPPIEVLRSGVTKIVDGYEAEEWTVHRTIDNKFIPVEEKLLVTRQFPFPDSLLRNLYLAQDIIEAGISIDRVAMYDTLLKDRVIPLRSDWHVTITPDTSFWYSTKLLSIHKTVVPDDFFLPPKGYDYFEPDVPSTEVVWMYKMIPMPGGPKKE